MKTIMITATMCTLALGMTASAFAGGNRGHGHSNFKGSFGHNGAVRNFHQPQFQIQHQNFHHGVNNGIQVQKFQSQQFPKFGHRNIAIAAPKFLPSQVRFQNYHLNHGTKFSGGYCYYGRNHNHWVSTNYCQQLGCTIYFCPCTSCWYYWNDACGCYVPIDFFPVH